MPAQGNMAERSRITQARLQRLTTDSAQSLQERKISKFVNMMKAQRNTTDECHTTSMTGVERPLKVCNSHH